MKLYTALVKAGAEPVLVREGFAGGALFLGPLWLAAHRAWIAAGIALAAFVLIAALVPEPAGAVIGLGLAFILGFTGHDLRRWTLEQRGYLLLHVVMAASKDDAFVRLLTSRPDLVARFRPRPA